MRVMRRAWSCAGAASSSERSDVGCPMSTMTLRPLTSTAKNLLTREVSVQFSANSSRSHDPSFCGARPQYTAVGTSMTSRTESARKASTSASRCGGGRRDDRGIPEAPAATHVEVGATLFHWQTAGTLLGIRQPGLGGDIAQHGAVRQRIGFEHVTHGHARRRERFRRLGWLHGCAYPQLEELSQQPAHAFSRATRRMMLGAGV